ncbi:hypothetical protein [Salimicrobium flavidum]|uniref:Hook-length control protein FliK n=1 Tax=Salimicrobium flavidum TaxID=570947 RepID=A0A1N7IKT1_9BACI|nr:hypothetical protein [Salimicrobium flavidum]SIS37699.1 hypothetical protein SAMN05421687_101425 [Salimicrobium flavidum]
MKPSMQNMFQSLQKVQKATPPSLNAGKVINGKVTELLPGNKAIVDIGGRQVNARLETSLTKGGNYLFQVQAQKNPVHLKVVSNEAKGNETVSLQKWMQAHGIKVNSQTMAFAKSLMDKQIPFNAQELKQAFSILQSSKNPLTSTVLKEMFERQLPIRTSVFQALSAGKQNQLGALFGQLSNRGNPFPPATRAAALLSSIVPSAGRGNFPQVAGQKLSNEVQNDNRQSFQLLKQAGALPPSETFGNFKSKVILQNMAGSSTGSPPGADTLMRNMQGAVAPQNDHRVASQSSLQRLFPVTAAFSFSENKSLMAEGTAEKIQGLFRQQAPLSGSEQQQLSRWSGQFSRIFQSDGNAKPSPALLQSFVNNHQQLTEQGSFSKLMTALTGAEKSSVQKMLGQISGEAAKSVHSNSGQTSNGTMVRMMEGAVARIDQALQSQVPSSLQKTLTEWTALSQRETPLPVQERLLLQVKAFQQLSGLDDEAVLRQNNSSPESSMKSGLLSLITDLSASKGEAGRNMLHFFNSMQMTASQENSHSLQFTLQFPGQLLETEKDIHVNVDGRKSEDGTIDPDHCHILFYLDLQSLKETVIDMQVQNRGVQVTVFNENEELTGIADGFEEKLQKGLENAGYSLVSLQVKNSGKEIPGKIPSSVTTSTYEGVDFRI